MQTEKRNSRQHRWGPRRHQVMIYPTDNSSSMRTQEIAHTASYIKCPWCQPPKRNYGSPGVLLDLSYVFSGNLHIVLMVLSLAWWLTNNCPSAYYVILEDTCLIDPDPFSSRLLACNSNANETLYCCNLAADKQFCTCHDSVVLCHVPNLVAII